MAKTCDSSIYKSQNWFQFNVLKESKYPSLHDIQVSNYPSIQKKSVSKISMYPDIRKKWYPLIPSFFRQVVHSGLWPRLDGWYGVSQSNLDSSLYDWLRVPGAESCYYHRLSLLFFPCVASSCKQCRGLTNGLSRTKDSSYCMYYKSLLKVR